MYITVYSLAQVHFRELHSCVSMYTAMYIQELRDYVPDKYMGFY